MKTRLASVCLWVVGCTFGGGSDDPTEGSISKSLDGGDVTDTDGDGTAMVRDASALDATVSKDAGSTDAGKAGDAGKCGPATAVAPCDPVRNTGCQVLFQCDLDSTGTSQAGRCVLYNPLALGGCTANAVSSTCTGGNACIDSACTQLCYCDSDCGTGKKCSGTAPGATGPVKFCQ